MLKIIQNSQTNISIGGFVYPLGTVFTGFLTITEDGDTLGNVFLNTSYRWFVDQGQEPVNGLTLPYGQRINIDQTNEEIFNSALLINSEMVRAKMYELFPNLDGQIQIII